MLPYSKQKLTTLYQKTKAGLPVIPQLGVLGVMLLLVFSGAITSLAISQDFGQVAKPVADTIQPPQPETTLPTVTTPADDSFSWDAVNITATAAFVWDVKNQRVLYEKNSDKVLPLASITKLMTALLAHELLRDNATILIGETAVSQDGGSYLHASDSFTNQAITELALMASANDGAYALAATAGATLVANDGANAFVDAMNIRADELNLHNTSFRNPTGLDISKTEAGSLSTAKETAFLMEYVLLTYPELLAATTKDQARIYDQTGSYYDVANTNKYLDQIPNILGSKTGYTDLAGGNLVVAFNAGLQRPIIISVLNSTWSERFSDVLTLVSATQQAINTQ